MEERPVFISAFAEAFRWKRLSVTQAALNEYLVGYSVLYRRFTRAFKRALNSVSDYELRRKEESWGQSKGDANSHLNDFLEAVYVSAELFEFYESDVVKLVGASKKLKEAYRSRLTKLKRFSTLLCNRCKHNHAFLQCVEIIYDNGHYVVGFSVYQMKGTTAVISKEVHSNSAAFSFNWTFRQLLGDLLQADMEAAALVAALPEKEAANVLSATPFNLPFHEELIAASDRPLTAMPSEIKKPRITRPDRGTFDVNLADWDSPKEGEGKMRVFLDLISLSSAYQLPYKEGQVETILTSTIASQALPEFFRVVIADLEVSD